MDNFGIFKLLNSFYDFYQKNSAKLAEKKESDNSSFNIFSQKPNNENTKPQTSITPKTNVETKEKTSASNPPRAYTTPLNEKMLCTMKNHDEFVKRVKGNGK